MIRSIALALAVLLAPAPAAASIIDVTFTGLATTFTGSRPDFSDRPFSAEFVFNTALGTLTRTAETNQLLGGFISGGASFVGGGAIALNSYESDHLVWTDDLSYLNAAAGYAYIALLGIVARENDLGIAKADLSLGHWQAGTCPGGFCGFFTRIDTRSMTIDGTPVAVPVPVVGSGLPALLLMAFAGLWRWRTQKSVARGRATPQS